MPFSSKIIGTGMFAPERIFKNDYFTSFLDTNDEWIRTRTGIKERRFADPSKGENPSFMAWKASSQAIKNANISHNDVEFIVLSNTIPDMFFPNTSSFVQSKLGITNLCGCIDVSAACAGFIYGLVMADALIKSGNYKKILVLATEMFSRISNFQDRATCILFGDAAGAFILEAQDNQDDQNNSDSRILSSILETESEKIDILKFPKGAANLPITEQMLKDKEDKNFIFNGKEIFKNAVKTLSLQLQTLLEKESLSIDDIDWLVPHQANSRIIDAIAQRLGLSKDKVITNVEKYANTSSASIPVAFHEGVTSGRIKRGDIIILATFGAGLTSGVVLLRY